MAPTRSAQLYKENLELIYDLKSLDLEDVSVKNMTEKELTSASPGVLPSSKFLHVTRLLLDHNDLSELPTEICEMKELKKVSVIGNQLGSLPESIGSLNNLEELYLDENEVSGLPLSIGNLKKLEILSAIANKLTTIDEHIFSGLCSLRKLCLDENMLSTLPSSFGEMTNLEWFECSENTLEMLPESFGNLKRLEVLDLDTNKLSSLPASFGSLPSLKVLLMSNNNISSLPKNMSSAQVLEKLCLDKNDLSELPKWFDDLKSIKDLAVDDNELLDKAFTEDFCQSACNLQSLSAGRNYISVLPQNIGMLHKLTVLHLGSTMKELERSNFQSGNWISFIPNSIVELVNLKKLKLDENQIWELPSEIGNLKCLEWLDLGQNQLESLPDSICDLKNLTYLQVSKNRLKSLPEGIGSLENLIELRLDSNQMDKLPSSLINLKGLQALDLFNNVLTEFPEALLSLRNLKRLDLDKNKFSVENIPRILPINCYPERDGALKDNWRGKTRGDKIRLEVIEISPVETEESNTSEEQEVYFNENALRNAMKAGMSLWRGHNDASERKAYVNGKDDANDSHAICVEKQWAFDLPSSSNDVSSFDPAPKSDFVFEDQEEDWDDELRDEYYQDTLNVCNSRKNVSSTLIDPFQNTINRYPPCIYAFSQTACYDSLVYKKSSPSKKGIIISEIEDDEQFADADD